MLYLKCRIEMCPILYSILFHSYIGVQYLHNIANVLLEKKKLFTAMAFTRGMEQKIHAQSHGKYVLFCRYVRHAKKKLLDFANKKANKKSNLVSCHWHPQTHVWHALNIYLYLYLYTAKLTYVTCIVFGYVFLSISTFSGITLCTSCLPLAIKSLAPTFAYL